MKLFLYSRSNHFVASSSLHFVLLSIFISAGFLTTSTCCWILLPQWKNANRLPSHWRRLQQASKEASTSDEVVKNNNANNSSPTSTNVVVIGAGWGGLSTAHKLAQSDQHNVSVTVVEASPRVGGLVRDGFLSLKGRRPAEAGQHGFWRNYHNIYRLFHDLSLDDTVNFDIQTALTPYAEQGQYSPAGLEAVWPVYRDQKPQLPTGLAQAVFTRFLNLPFADLLSAFPLVLAFSEFDDSPASWERFDKVSFRDMCIKLGVSQRCYEEAFEPMILTGLFAPGAECSAAAALGMAYFFVLQHQTAFDVQWCRGNIGKVVFDPWVEHLKATGKVDFLCSTRVTGFEIAQDKITHVKVQDANKSGGNINTLQADHVILAVGAKALNNFVRFCPELAAYSEFCGFANLRGTSVLATRLFLDRNITVPYSANACWGFDEGVGMTVFDIRALHGTDATTVADAPGSVIEVDYYHASNLLAMSDDDIIAKAKADLDKILGAKCKASTIVDAAVVRLPQGVNWYFPGSYKDMPDVKSNSIDNLYFAGDIVRTRHGSWSQEKAFVSGMEAANFVLEKERMDGIIPLGPDELHVRVGKDAVALARRLIADASKGLFVPSLVDFPW